MKLSDIMLNIGDKNPVSDEHLLAGDVVVPDSNGHRSNNEDSSVLSKANQFLSLKKMIALMCLLTVSGASILCATRITKDSAMVNVLSETMVDLDPTANVAVLTSDTSDPSTLSVSNDNLRTNNAGEETLGQRCATVSNDFFCEVLDNTQQLFSGIFFLINVILFLIFKLG